MRSRIRILLVAALVATALVPAAPALAGGNHHPPAPGPDAVLSWNLTATKAAAAACFSPSPSGNPVVESRLYAMTHIAIHDALNAIHRESRPYRYHTAKLNPGASPEAAVAAAARFVLVPGIEELTTFLPQTPCVDNGVAVVTAAYDAALLAIPDGPKKNAGIALGKAAAAAIIAKRTGDGSVTLLFDTGFHQGSAPGEYRFTPGQTFAFAPEWGKVKPFTLLNANQFTPSGPYKVDSAQYATDFNEVKSLGGDGNSPGTTNTRTPDQTTIAEFWVGSSPFQWNDIARTVSVSQHVGMWGNARLFAVLNMAMADGYTGTFATKYLNPKTNLFWRPVTAIQEAATDGNAATTADPTWLPLEGTPPIPDYDSGHAVQGGAASAVLKGFFHTDRISFSSCSPTLPATNNSCAGGSGTDPGVVRPFTSFSQAATENGLSRIYIGFHFRKAVTDGIRHGQQIGNWAISRCMGPAR